MATTDGRKDAQKTMSAEADTGHGQPGRMDQFAGRQFQPLAQ